MATEYRKASFTQYAVEMKAHSEENVFDINFMKTRIKLLQAG
jgi:hypothetical protein